jgi:hypothetical protein
VVELAREPIQEMLAWPIERVAFSTPWVCKKTDLPARLAALNLFLLVTVYLLGGRE